MISSDCLNAYLSLLSESSDRRDFLNRLNSSNHRRRAPAEFELAIWELLTEAGNELIEVHPVLSHTEKSPDFLFKSKTGTTFFVECVDVAVDEWTSSSDALREGVLKSLQEVDHSGVAASLRFRGELVTEVSKKKLKAAARKWVEECETEEWEVFFRHDNCELSLRRIEMVNPANELFIKTIPRGVRLLSPGKTIRGALEKKANRYGELGQPYIIAINDHRAVTGVDDLFAGSFGWSGKRGALFDRAPIRTQVSGILLAKGLSFSSFGTSQVFGLENPWAKFPSPSLGIQLNRVDAQIVDGKEVVAFAVH